MTTMTKESKQEVHLCGSWPDPTWTEGDFKAKRIAMKKCHVCNPKMTKESKQEKWASILKNFDLIIYQDFKNNREVATHVWEIIKKNDDENHTMSISTVKRNIIDNYLNETQSKVGIL